MITAEMFVAKNCESILITHRGDGGVQASPVRVLIDSAGSIVACTKNTTAKAKNLRRDSRFALCVMTHGWSGPWMTIEGQAELTYLPEALQGLKEFYLQRDGSVARDDEFSNTMQSEGRLLIRFHVDRTAGTAD